MIVHTQPEPGPNPLYRRVSEQGWDAPLMAMGESVVPEQIFG